MLLVLFDSDHCRWLLCGPTTLYAVRLVGDDTVRHVHWGAAPALTEAVKPAQGMGPGSSTART